MTPEAFQELVESGAIIGMELEVAREKAKTPLLGRVLRVFKSTAYMEVNSPAWGGTIYYENCPCQMLEVPGTWAIKQEEEKRARAQKKKELKEWFEEIASKRCEPKACRWCGEEFIPTRSPQFYCSERCRKQAAAERTRKPTVTRACAYCGKEFTTTRSDRMYCCRQCTFKADRAKTRALRHPHAHHDGKGRKEPVPPGHI